MNSIVSQPCEFSNPCREITEAVFDDSPTLCESVSGFDPDYTIRPNTYASSIDGNIWTGLTGIFYNVDILIQGNFYIDESIYFSNCRIKMAAGAQIIVTTQLFKTELRAVLTKFYSCDDMWKGIVFQSGTRCTLFKCHIEDAQFALTIGNYVSLSLNNNLFNRNFVGITNGSGVTSLPFLLLKNNTFDCTSALSDYYDLDFSCCAEDPVTFAGILLNDCSSSIGYYGSRNRFNSLNYGIFINNGTVSIQGCEFRDAQHSTLIPDLVQASPIKGCGIAAIYSNIQVVGDEEYVSLIFESSDIIATKGTNLYVSFVKFIDGGIFVDENFNGEMVRIEDNWLNGEVRQSNIGVERSMASGDDYHTYISRNRITHISTPHTPFYGIRISALNNSTDYAKVDNNIIKSSSIPESYSGIRYLVRDGDHTEIDNNFIQFSQSDNKVHGIYSYLGSSTVVGSRIMQDTIVGNIMFNEDTYGITSQGVQGLTYCLNRINHLNYGMTFIGNCDNSSISQNEIDTLVIGLQLKNLGEIGGVFGVQNGTRNYWVNEGNNCTKAAENLSTSSYEFSMYNITNEDLSNHSFNPLNTDPADGWFELFGGDNELCYEKSPIVTGFDSIIITDEYEFSSLPEGAKFYLKKQLLYKILDDGDLTTYYSTFLSGEDDNSEYALALAEIGMKEAMQMDLTDQSDLDGILTSMHSLYDSIQLYNNYNYAHIDSTTFTEGLYLDSIHSKLEQVWNAMEDQQIIKSARMTVLTSDLASISSDLALITPRGTFDEYYIAIYSLLIEKITNGSLDPGDYDVLNDIAHDLEDNSLANVAAFEYFNLCSEHAYPDYSIVCEEEPRIERKGTDIDKAVSVIAVSSELLKAITFNCSEGFNGSIEIFDLMGRCVFQNKLGVGQSTISLNSTLLPGMYYFRVMDDFQTEVIYSGLIPIVE